MTPVTLVQTPPPAPAWAPAALSPDATVRFLRTEAADLRSGLRRAERGEDVRAVIERHHAAHERWLGVIAAAALAGRTDLVQRLAHLYVACGRVARCLERGLDPCLEPAVAHHVRVVLASDLQQRAEACVTAVRAATTS